MLLRVNPLSFDPCGEYSGIPPSALFVRGGPWWGGCIRSGVRGGLWWQMHPIRCLSVVVRGGADASDQVSCEMLYCYLFACRHA